jgi:EAL domain-containing protein (putative c-di-GMP-specific phosphodiesterase class I)
MSLKTGQACWAEALVRWNHPEHGLVLPDKFIGLAEETGLIEPLTIWVLENALEQCRLWHRMGLEIGIAVNLSARTLHSPLLVDAIGAMLQKRGVNPSRLKLEITESTVMADPERAMQVLTPLTQMGIIISIDDFGTGYSSLAHLKRLPVAEIKIDRSFVTDLRNNDSDAVIVRSVLDLARNLGLDVVAEGVEDRATWNMLAEMGCDLLQGNYLSPPLPADDLVRWYRDGPAKRAAG